MDKLSWFLAGILVGGLVGIAVMGYITGDAVDTMTPNATLQGSPGAQRKEIH